MVFWNVRLEMLKYLLPQGQGPGWASRGHSSVRERAGDEGGPQSSARAGNQTLTRTAMVIIV